MTDEEHTERALLQRRIRNQRAEIRRLNKCVIAQAQSIKFWRQQVTVKRADSYRHAAQIAESILFGRWAAKAIRRWL